MDVDYGDDAIADFGVERGAGKVGGQRVWRRVGRTLVPPVWTW